MIRILLVRHGSTELLGRVLYGRLPGALLSAAGREEAKRLAVAIGERWQLQQVLSSPLERTQETAQFIAQAQGLSVATEEGINEIDFGSWMGKTFDELHNLEEWKRYNQVRSLVCPPGGESMTQVQARAWAALERIMRNAQPGEKPVAVVSHGDVIRGLLLLLLGMPIDHIHRIEVACASVSEILHVPDQHPRVVSINQTF